MIPSAQLFGRNYAADCLLLMSDSFRYFFSIFQEFPGKMPEVAYDSNNLKRKY